MTSLNGHFTRFMRFTVGSVQSRNWSKWVICPTSPFGSFQKWSRSNYASLKLEQWTSSCFPDSTGILSFVKNELSFCCHFIMEQKQKNKVNKQSTNRSVKLYGELEWSFYQIHERKSECRHGFYLLNVGLNLLY